MNVHLDADAKLRAMEAELAAARQAAAVSEQEARAVSGQLQGLNDEVARLNRELQASCAQMREVQDGIVKNDKLAQLGQLIATIAHDIRNPLGSIRTSSFILERQLKDGPENARKPLERIKKGVDRCEMIITELLDFARTQTLQLEPMVFDHWMAETITEYKGEAIQAVDIVCQPGLNETKIPFDPSRMERALVNLISNAVEAMVGKADNTIENPTHNPKVLISSRLSARGIELSVTDNGPGISDEDMSKIFDPLYTTKSFGVGLGLSAVQKIFEEHGGGLEAVSQPGNGATFTGWFPAEQNQTAAA